MSPGPLPPLTQALLDAPTLAALFADLAEHADVLDVITKGAPRRHAAAEVISLDAAREALNHGVAVQVRYRWDGAEWLDTLMPSGAGARIVRIQRE